MYKLSLNESKFLPHAACEIEFNYSQERGLVITGENGLGKTTLLRKLWLKEEEPAVLIEQKSMDYFFDRTLFVFKKILFESQSEFIDKNLFQKLWQDFGLKNKEDRLLSQLSGGESQALKIIVGISRKVDWFYLDEPSQFLDQSRREVLKALIQELRSMNKNLIIVEHDLSWIPERMQVTQLILSNGIIQKGKEWIT
ncbi:MAG: ATP-binding cassette domain-containing protein [Bacteriovoracaceae bacterium]